MPIIRRKIPGTNKVVLVRYPKTLFPRLKNTMTSDKEPITRPSIELADNEDQKWLEDEVLGNQSGGLFSSFKTTPRKRGQTPVPA